MSKELVIGSNRHETKVAILEEDQLVEVYFQRANEYSLAGSIHKGRVTRVLPGMQSAFVDLGLERDTFLYVSDFFEEHEDIDTVEEHPARPERREGSAGRTGERRESERAENRREPLRAIEPVQIPKEESESDELDESAALAEESVSQPVASTTEMAPRQSASDSRGQDTFRGNDRGDRRGRRSRRRRQRPNGFPDNKYAQPSSTAAATPATAMERRADVSAFEPEEPSDAIVLPGESLAKYRNRSPVPETSRTEYSFASEPEKNVEPDTGYGDAGGSSESSFETPEPLILPEDAISEQENDVASEEDLSQAAEELALTDKVFSHHDDLSPAEVEANLAEVQSETPEVIAERSPEESSEEAPVYLYAETAEFAEVSASGLHGLLVSEPSDAIGLRGEGGEAVSDRRDDDFQAAAEEAALDEGVPPVDESIPDNALPAAEGGPIETAPLLAQDAEIVGPQTAMLRDPGIRQSNRLSRRMRRRRGGNRFSGQGSSAAASTSAEVEAAISAAPAELSTASLATAAGTAMAAEPQFEPRREVPREAPQEKSLERPERVYPSISDLLKPGQEIIAQIAKEPLGQKGARITSHIALPGRYVVFMPSVTHLGVSRKVASDEERQRLKRILQAHRVGTTGGFIVRTAGEGVPEEEIAADMNFLYNLWLDIRQKAEKKPAPALLHYDLDIVQRILRDQVTPEFKAIWVDNEELYERVLTFMQRFQPSLVNRIKMYTRPAPIFDAFNITQELEKALRPKVWLKSGGYIVINQTEALVAIDINTGKYVGKSNRLEDTIVKTNTEAVKEIVRQIRLRDLGGIIVVDFIDMDERKNRQKVMQALEEAMRADKAPYKILQFNDFGLVAITRKRVKQSLERTLCAPCPYCEGAGYVKSVQTVVSEILVEAQKIAKAIEGSDVMLRVHPDVAKLLKASSNQFLEELESILGRPVLVTGDATLHHQRFDLG